jgi:hypothetical protein
MRAQDEARETRTGQATAGGRSTVSRRGLLRGGAVALLGGTAALAACTPGGAPATGQPAGGSRAPATVRFAAAGVGLPAGTKPVEPAWTYVKWLTSADDDYARGRPLVSSRTTGPARA